MNDLENTPLIARIEDNVYVIGVCHVAESSQVAVKNLIRSVQPDVVVLELCESREGILFVDEDTRREALGKEDLGGFTLDPGTNIRKLYAFLAKKLGLLPGFEMKTAYDEAKKIPGTKVLLGDLPIELTRKKLDQGLSFWTKLKLAFAIFFFFAVELPFYLMFKAEEQMRNKILKHSQDNRQTENTEKRDLLLDGRDEFLTYSLQKAADDWIFDEDGQYRRPIVVGVVGAAHIPGILSNWGKITEDDINQLLASYD